MMNAITDYAIHETEIITFNSASELCRRLADMPGNSEEFRKGCNYCAAALEMAVYARKQQKENR